MTMRSASVRLRRRQALLGLLALGYRGTEAAPRPARVIRALAESWPPYLRIDARGAMHGLDAELLQAICRQAGYELQWVQASPEWRKRRFAELLNDRFDVVFSATPSETRADAVMYTQRYRDEVMMVAAPWPHDPALDRLRSFDDLLRQHVHLLHVDAQGIGDDFEAHRAALQQAGLLVPYPTSPMGINMLLAERAPLILGDTLDLQFEARERGLHLVRQPYGYSAQPVSIMLSRRRLDEADLARVNQAIRALEQNGTLSAIRRRYGLT